MCTRVNICWGDDVSLSLSLSILCSLAQRFLSFFSYLGMCSREDGRRRRRRRRRDRKSVAFIQNRPTGKRGGGVKSRTDLLYVLELPVVFVRMLFSFDSD